ncbi:hypothetical protein GJAV_G00061630 [Gymnothorax javanicus]|nr:hypothetical protein GJAV_G00061630 [Gymnothorax javanicus]
MSIDTLLEAAKFLEWQALQQQKTREEDELREKLHLNQDAKRVEVSSFVPWVGVNHVTTSVKFSPEHCPTPALPPAAPPPVPIAHQVESPVLPQTTAASPSENSPLPQPVTTLQPASTNDSHNLDAKKRPGGPGTREVHNKLEKNRRAHLKECFETLKKTVPTVDEKKTSNLSVLRSALRYIQTLKRKEKEYEHEMERLAREKISTQQRLAELKNELSQWMNILELERLLRLTTQPEDDQASTSTASEGEDNVDDDAEEDRLQPPPKVPHLAKATPTSAPTQLSQLLIPPSVTPQGQGHAHTPVVTPLSMPSVIAHASVIQSSTKHVAPPVLSSAPQAIGPAPCSTPQPISHITVHPVAHLYPPTAMMSQLAHALTPAQLNSLTSAQLNMLTPTHVNTLTPAHVSTVLTAHMNTLTPTQVNTLTSAQMNTLVAAQVNTVKATQVNTLTQTPVNTLTPAQVNTLTQTPANMLTPAQVNSLTQTVVNTLAPAQVNTQRPTQVNSLMPAQLNLPTQTQVNSLTAAQVNALTPTQVNTLTPAQVNTLTHAQVSCQPAVVTHSQLMGQTVLNPVTMVTVPSFPVSTLKLA